MSSDNSRNSQNRTPSYDDDGPATTAQARGPRRVQWAPKTRVEHVELDTADEDDEPRSLDEYGQDPAALEHLRRALESYQQQPSTSAELQKESGHADAELAEQRLWEKRARDLVHTHRRKRVLFSRVTDAAGRARRFGRHAARTEDKEKREDLEANASGATNIAPLPLGRGRGVLSTLLALYDTRSGSRSASATSSAVNSPIASRSTSPVDLTPRLSDYDSRPPPIRTDSAQSSSSDAKKTQSFRIPLPSTASTSRPKAARSAGGVIGSLIATSGNLTGPAAPLPSTVGPNVKRPGWGLSRYAIAPEETLRRYPHRRTHSAPTTPRPSSPDDYFGPVSDASGTATPTFSGGTPPPGFQHRPKRPVWDLLTHSRSASAGESGTSTPTKGGTPPAEAALSSANWDGKAYRRDRKERRRKAEIYITKHVAEIMQRQEFLLKLTRALMMFAAPSHRLQAQIQATARVLDLETSTLYIPNVILIAFGDDATGTSNIKFIQQTSSLDLGKLLDTHRLYWKVIHDKISVSCASTSLDLLMRVPPLYRNWELVLMGGLCSGAICPLAFSGSFVDSLIAVPLGALLVLVQIFSSRNELYSNVFEITIATVLSFISAALGSTPHFCYSAVASSSVVLILPGFIVLSGSLELASRQIVSGAVRICFAAIYSLFLGFGLAIGADVYSSITSVQVLKLDDITCSASHRPNGPWWQRTPSLWWAFLCVPLYSFALSLRNQAPLLRKELLVTIVISCGGWAANHFSGTAFVNRPDIQSAVGAFAVGIVANVYARFFKGNAYVVMITGILFQLPSGLANGGLLTFAAVDNQGQAFQSYKAGFQVALQLIAVAVGLTVGLFTSVVVVHPLGGSRRRAAGLFSL